MLMRSALWNDLLAPFNGRFERALEITFAAMLVVIVSMTFQIPSPATSAYVIFFAAKENAGLNIVTSIVFIIVVTFAIGLLFVLAPASLNNSSLRILVIASVAFFAFFLEVTSKLAPVSGTIGLVAAYGLDLLQESFIGEITTRGLLYAWLFVAVPMVVFIAYSIIFGRKPDALLRNNLAARMRCAAAALSDEYPSARAKLALSLEEGNIELGHELKMIKLFRYQPPETAAQLSALTPLTYALLMVVDTFSPEDAEQACAFNLPARLKHLAIAVERRKNPAGPYALRTGTPQSETGSSDAPVNCLVGEALTLLTMMEDVIAGRAKPESATPSHGKTEKPGFFVKDAFTNAAHVGFAAKGMLSVMICYLTFNLLDWPGIHTCMITCFIVTLTTVGETLEKMSLRIAGCLVGAALGLFVIVFILPQATSITDLVLMIGLVTFPAAWIAVGRPSVAYIGFQAAFALYLCILQGTEPKFDLTLARDRVIGILFGNVVVYIVSTCVFPVSILPKLRSDLKHVLDGCTAVLRAMSESQTIVARAERVAGLHAMMAGVAASSRAFALEAKIAKARRLRIEGAALDVEGLRDFSQALGWLAAFPVSRSDEQHSQRLRTLNADIEAELKDIGARLDGDTTVLSDTGMDTRPTTATAPEPADPCHLAQLHIYETAQKSLRHACRPTSDPSAGEGERHV